MASPPTAREREEQRRFDVRTLVIASAASASAALIVSRLWFAGTWIAAAITPVIVAVVSELLHRPTDRIVRRTVERDAVLPEAAGAAPPARSPEPGAPAAAPMRVYRQPVQDRRRRMAISAVAVTALLAFGIAGAAITVPELIAGQSVGKGDRKTTLFGGQARTPAPGGSTEDETTTETVTTEKPERTPREETTESERTTPDQTSPEQTTPRTQTTPPSGTTTTPPATPQAQTAPQPPPATTP